MSFEPSEAESASTIFITRKAEVTGRWDPAFFRPELVALEKRVSKVTSRRLRDYVQRMAGGATPSTKEAATHYTEGSDGVPFIRVQNLSPTGNLNLADCKLITRSTHEGLLSRSRLSGGELLVKITGVGRMAIASVVPDGFEANINQHIVAITTKDRKTSETLAAWLNLDSAERLASRRSTGGTRPALDYPALLSLPIVFDERLPVLIGAAVAKFQQRIAKAKQILARIDDEFILALGIRQESDPPNSIESRTFRRSFAEVTGRRLDPNFSKHMARYLKKMETCIYPLRRLKDFVTTVQYGISERATVESVGVPMLRMLNLQDGDWDLSDLKYIAMNDEEKRPYLLHEGDILFNRTNSKELVGKCNVFNLQGEFVFASYLMRVSLKQDVEMLPDYIVAYMASSLGRIQIDAVSRQIAGMTNINAEEVRELLVPAPAKSIQQKLCERISEIREEARVLRSTAHQELESAKKEIEMLILGKWASA